jgi:AraC-like DNA-binding protein
MCTFSVAKCSFPFHASTPGEFAPAPGALAAAGDILLVRLATAAGNDDSGAGGEHEIPSIVREIRQRQPGCAVALWIPEAPTQVVINATRAASQAQVRAILGGGLLDPDLLRVQLTQPHGLSAFVLRWASDAGYLPDGMEQEDVRELLDAPPDVRTLARLALRRHVAARTWRSRLQQLGLPSPYAWLGLAHALHVAFFVQRNHTQPLQTLCDRLGMQTVANMSKQFRRVFGLSPSQVRGLLGAEPLLYRWFHARTAR